MRAWTAVGNDSLVGQLDGGQRDNAQWPALASWWALHRLLRVWAPREGFYSLANAWPWGLLLLLRFHDGAFVGEVLRGGSSMRESRVEVLRIEFGPEGKPSKVTVCGRAGRVDPMVPTTGGLSLVSQRSMPLRGRGSRSLAHAQLTAPGLTLMLKPPRKRKAKKLALAEASGISQQEEFAAASGGGRPSPVQRLRQRVAQLMGVGESYGAATEALAAAEGMEGGGPEEGTAAEASSSDEDEEGEDDAEPETEERGTLAGVFGGGNDIAALSRVARAWDPSAMLNPAMDPTEAAKALNVELVASLLNLSGGWLHLRSVEGPCVAAKGVALQAAAALAAAVAVADDEMAVVGTIGCSTSSACSDALGAQEQTSAVPYVRPGLYAGAYGDMYGQHKHEVLLVEYRSFTVTAADVSPAGWQHGNSGAGKVTSVWGRIWREVFDGRPDPQQPGFGLFNTPSSCAMLVRVRDAIATHLTLMAANQDPVGQPSSLEDTGQTGDAHAAPCISGSCSNSNEVGTAAAECSEIVTTESRSGTEIVDEAFSLENGKDNEVASSFAAEHLLSVEAVFCVGRKVTGDAHVPAGAASWGALCYPPVYSSSPAGAANDAKSSSSEANSGSSAAGDDELAGDGSGFPHFQPATSVVGRHNNARIPVNRAWPGWGTLAFPGFERPSWSDGQLCQLRGGGGSGGGSEDGEDNDDGRFAFMWDREESQPATVLKWLSVQQEYPFVNSA